MQQASTKPYLLRAIYEWCTDNGFTPYIAVSVDGRCRVPMQYVKDGEIVLNVGMGATSGLKMDNTMVRFSARFGGIPHMIEIPVGNVMAIYASENGQGMAFEVEYLDDAQVSDDTESTSPDAPVLVAVSTNNDAETSDVQTTDNAISAEEKKNEKKSTKHLLKIVK